MADVPQHEFSADEERAMRAGNRESFSDEAARRGDAAMSHLPPRSYKSGDETFSQERDRLGAAAMSKLPPRPYAAPQGLSSQGQSDVKGAIEDIASRAKGD